MYAFFYEKQEQMFTIYDIYYALTFDRFTFLSVLVLLSSFIVNSYFFFVNFIWYQNHSFNLKPIVQYYAQYRHAYKH